MPGAEAWEVPGLSRGDLFVVGETPSLLESMCRVGRYCLLARLGLGAGLLFLLAGAVGAQILETEFDIRSWGVRNNLPQAGINSVQRASHGYLWLGTKRGLIRFDGIDFKVFESQNTKQLRTNLVQCVLADARGGLWVATADGLFYAPDGRPECGLVEVGNRLVANALAAGPGGQVWALTASNGVARIVDRKVVGWLQGPKGRQIRAMAIDEQGKLTVAAGKTLYVEHEGGLLNWAADASDLISHDIEAIAPSRKGGFWIAGGRQVCLVREGGIAFTPKPERDAKESPKALIATLLEDKHGWLWVGTTGGGIYCFHDAAGWQQVSARRSRSFGGALALYEDEEGSIWSGTSAGVLHQIKPRLLTRWSLPTAARENVPQTICIARDGAVWIGTDGAGVFRCQDGLFARFEAAESLNKATVMAMLEDRQTNLWFGTFNGLFCLEQGRLQPELTNWFAGQTVPAL